MFEIMLHVSVKNVSYDQDLVQSEKVRSSFVVSIMCHNIVYFYLSVLGTRM